MRSGPKRNPRAQLCTLCTLLPRLALCNIVHDTAALSSRRGLIQDSCTAALPLPLSASISGFAEICCLFFLTLEYAEWNLCEICRTPHQMTKRRGVRKRAPCSSSFMTDQRQLLFPNIRPLDDPPPREGILHCGRRTPCYALGWKCRAAKYGRLMTEANLGLQVSNVREEAAKRWIKEYDFPSVQHPVVYLGPDGNFYLIAMFNISRLFPDFATRAIAMDPNDPLIVAAKHILLVTEDLQASFKWYRYPMRWTVSNRGEENE